MADKPICEVCLRHKIFLMDKYAWTSFKILKMGHKYSPVLYYYRDPLVNKIRAKYSTYYNKTRSLIRLLSFIRSILTPDLGKDTYRYLLYKILPKYMYRIRFMSPWTEDQCRNTYKDLLTTCLWAGHSNDDISSAGELIIRRKELINSFPKRTGMILYPRYYYTGGGYGH